jgi:non-lysosomal glucosylceramidase
LDPPDYDGHVFGNWYNHIFADSAAVAQSMAKPGKLAAVVKDINTHHHVIAHPNNPTPDWMKDMLVNQFSHFHMFMWFADGRMREYEAWSCDDVDSVHNDYQRHLPYLWVFPEFEEQKLRAWGGWAQASDGHVNECLAGFGHGQMDKATGR